MSNLLTFVALEDARQQYMLRHNLCVLPTRRIELYQSGQIVHVEPMPDNEWVEINPAYLARFCNEQATTARIVDPRFKVEAVITFAFRDGLCMMTYHPTTLNSGEVTKELEFLIPWDGRLPKHQFGTYEAAVGKQFSVEDAQTYTTAIDGGFPQRTGVLTGRVVVMGISALTREALVRTEDGTRYVIDTYDLN